MENIQNCIAKFNLAKLMMTKGATQIRWNTLLQACLITTENTTLACRPISVTGYTNQRQDDVT